MFDYPWNKLLKLKVAPRQRLKLLLSDVDLEVRLDGEIIGTVGAGSVSLLGKLQDINSKCKFEIGRHCQANGSSKISLGGEHSIERHINNSFSGVPLLHSSIMNAPPALNTKGRCVIGNGVIIGINAVVLSGTNIGDGCIVGASALCTKEYPEFSILGGIPARVLRARPQSAKSQKVPYWDLKLSTLYSVLEGKLCLDNVSKEQSLRRSSARVVLDIKVRDGKVIDSSVTGIKVKGKFFELNRLSETFQNIFKQVASESDSIVITNDFDELLFNEELLLIR